MEYGSIPTSYGTKRESADKPIEERPLTLIVTKDIQNHLAATTEWKGPRLQQQTVLRMVSKSVVIIIIIEKHTSEGAKEQKHHKLSYMVEAEDTIKSNSD